MQELKKSIQFKILPAPEESSLPINSEFDLNKIKASPSDIKVSPSALTCIKIEVNDDSLNTRKTLSSECDPTSVYNSG